MSPAARLPAALLALRLSVFLVMLVWTLDKFLAPGHAAEVYAHFYFIGGLGPTALYLIGAVSTPTGRGEVASWIRLATRPGSSAYRLFAYHPTG